MQIEQSGAMCTLHHTRAVLVCRARLVPHCAGQTLLAPAALPLTLPALQTHAADLLEQVHPITPLL